MRAHGGYLGLVTPISRGERIDRLVAAGLLVAALVVLATGDPTPGLPTWVAIALSLVIPAAVAVRRRWPLAVGVVVVLLTNLVFILGAHNYSPPLAVAWMCAIYGIAVWTSTAGFLVGLGALAASKLLTILGVNELSDAVFFTVVPGVAMVIARRAVRERELKAEALAARAELLEREQERRATEAVEAERARIARELHDLVAHNVSVMVVQAGAERHSLPKEQESTRETLSSIERAGRQALAEARRLLGMLRPADEPQHELEPQPSLDQLDMLIEQVRRAGLPVVVEVDGDRVPLPAGVDLCAYRVVQEGLTNALKHAGPAHASVHVRYGREALEVEVRDDGAGAPQRNGDGAGHGLIGMRERVALYGGDLHAGPREGNGFEVRARIPLA